MNDMMNGDHWGWRMGFGMGWGIWIVLAVVILVVGFSLYKRMRKK